MTDIIVGIIFLTHISSRSIDLLECVKFYISSILHVVFDFGADAITSTAQI